MKKGIFARNIMPIGLLGFVTFIMAQSALSQPIVIDSVVVADGASWISDWRLVKIEFWSENQQVFDSFKVWFNYEQEPPFRPVEGIANDTLTVWEDIDPYYANAVNTVRVKIRNGNRPPSDPKTDGIILDLYSPAITIYMNPDIWYTPSVDTFDIAGYISEGPASYVASGVIESSVWVSVYDTTRHLYWQLGGGWGPTYAEIHPAIDPPPPTNIWNWGPIDFDENSPDSSGYYEITVFAQDSVGWPSTSTIHFHFDVAAPTSQLTSPTPGEWYGLSTVPNIAGTVIDELNGSTVNPNQFQIALISNNQHWNGVNSWEAGITPIEWFAPDVRTGTSWSDSSVTYQSLTLPTTPIIVKQWAVDVAGNMDDTFADTFLFDKAPPTSALTYPPPNEWYSRNTGHTFGNLGGNASDVGSGLEALTISIHNSGTNEYWHGTGPGWQVDSLLLPVIPPITSWSYNFSSSNITNTCTITVKQYPVDSVGNSPTNIQNSFYFDYDVPDVDIDYPLATTWYSWEGDSVLHLMAGTIDDNEQSGENYVKLEIRSPDDKWWDGSDWQLDEDSLLIEVGGAQDWQYQITDPDFADALAGICSLFVWGYDSVENVSSMARRGFKFDAHEPDIEFNPIFQTEEFFNDTTWRDSVYGTIVENNLTPSSFLLHRLHNGEEDFMLIPPPDGLGNWSKAFSTTDGPYALWVTATDSAGNAGNSGTVDFTYDGTPPAYDTLITDSTYVHNGKTAIYTLDPTFTFKFIAEDALSGLDSSTLTITCTIIDSTVDSTRYYGFPNGGIAQVSDYFEFTSFYLDNDFYTFEVYCGASDLAGNALGKVIYDGYLDVHNPLPRPIPYAPDSLQTQNPEITFSWSIVDSALRYRYDIVRSADTLLIYSDTTNSNLETEVTYTISTGEGWYHWKVRSQTDTSYSEWTDSLKFKYDTTAAAISEFLIENGALFIPGDTVSLFIASAADDIGFATIIEDGISTVVPWGDTTFINFTYPFAVPSEGLHSLQCRLADFAGNISDPVSASITLDMTPPAISSLTAATAAYDSTLPMRWLLFDTLSHINTTSVEISLAKFNASNHTWTWDALNSGEFSFSGDTCFLTTPLPATQIGLYGVAYSISAQDYAGNPDTLIGGVGVDFSADVLSPLTLSESPFYNDTIPQYEYMLISIPAQLDNASPESVITPWLGNPDNTRWRLWQWNDSTDDYDEYPNVDSLDPGISYFLQIRDYPDSIDFRTGAGQTTPPEPDTISIAPGWNFIANPYSFRLSVDRISYPASPDNDYFFEYDEGWKYPEDVNVLKPWSGYLVHNDSSFAVDMVFNPLPNLSAGVAGGIIGAKNKSLAASTLAENEWHFIINTKTGNFGSWICIGSDLEALPGYDRRDLPRPPLFMEHSTLWLAHPQESGAHRYLSRDLRPPSEQGNCWNVTHLSSFENAQVDLDWELRGALPQGWQAVLLDGRDNTVVNLTSAAEYSFFVPGQPRQSKLYAIIGTEAYVNSTLSQLMALLPQEFALAPAFPNPFNEAVTLHYSVKKTSRVKLEVYDVLGRRVVQLLDDWRDPGVYRLNWKAHTQQGLPCASGMYFARYHGDGFQKIQKLVLLR